MDLGSLRLLALDAHLATVGVDATVTPVGGAAVVTRGAWTQALAEQMPFGHDFSKREPRRVMALSRASVPDVPRGSTIVAAEYAGAPVRTWKVDGIERQDADQVRVIVIAA